MPQEKQESSQTFGIYKTRAMYRCGDRVVRHPYFSGLALVMLLAAGFSAGAGPDERIVTGRSFFFEVNGSYQTLESAENVASVEDATQGNRAEGEPPDQRLIARTVSTINWSGVGIEVGDRLGSDIVIDGTGLWGAHGNAVDMVISAIVKPTSLLILLDSLKIVELRGVWGTSGALYPSETIVHGPVWDVDSCGKASAIAELLREVSEPDGVQPDPLLAVGTEGGCVGFVGYETPPFWFQNAADWLDESLVATGDPLIGVWGTSGSAYPIDDLAVIRVDDNWNVIPADWEAPTDDWVAPTSDWFPAVDDWFPNPADWVPNPNTWLEVAAVSGGQLHSIFPGRRPIGDTLGFPPFSTFEMVDAVEGEQLTSLSGPALPLTSQPAVIIDDPPVVLIESPLVGNSVEAAVRVSHADFASVDWGSTTVFPEETLTPISAPLVRIVLGSLLGVPDGGGPAIFLPEFNPGTGDSGPQATIGGVLGVDLGPRAFNLGASGNFITAAIEAADNDIDQIMADSIRLTIEGGAGAPLEPIRVRKADKDGDGHWELAAKFDRAQVHARLAPFDVGSQAVLSLSWDYTDDCDINVPCSSRYAQIVTLVND